MNPKWLMLVADLLEYASDQMGKSGCNDWDWPEGWTEAERIEVAKAIAIDDGEDVEYDSQGQVMAPVDFQIADFLRGQILKAGGKE